MQSFEAGTDEWPLKWSHDDKYLARLKQGQGIYIWETPSFSLLDKKPLKISGVRDFCWSPSQHVISCWVPEHENIPAVVLLIDIPSKKEKRKKNLFNVSDCKMHWQNRGDYLCVKVDRFKSKKSTFTNFELFFMKEKNVPIEVLELKHSIIAFAWEPNGSRFAIIHSSESAKCPDVSFYGLEGTQLKHLKTLEKRPASHLFWSPRGDFIVLAGLRNHNGVLEFYNVNDMETFASSDHSAATELEWDPTGRYVTTYASAWRHQLENGYCIWSFSGKLLSKVLKDKFFINSHGDQDHLLFLLKIK